MSQILTQLQDIIETDYKPALANQLNTDPSPFLEKVKKIPLVSDEIKFAAPLGINGGFGFGYEGTNTPAPGAQKYISFVQHAVDMYCDIRISDKTVKLASNNKGAALNALDGEINGAYIAAKWNLGRALFGAGDGKLATFTATATNVKVATLSSVVAVIEGLTVDVFATGATTATVTGARIVSIDRATKKVTLDKDVGVTAGFITVQNSFGREITGLGSIFDDNVTTLYGVTKADNPWIKPLVMDANHDLSDNMLHKMVRDAKDIKNAKIDMILMGDDAFLAYQTFMRDNNVTVVEKKQYVGGAVGYKVLVGSNEVEVVNERFIPTAEAWGVDTTSFELHHTDWDFAREQSNSIFTLVPNTSIYRALLANYGNIVCKNPGGCFRLTNCDLTA